MTSILKLHCANTDLYMNTELTNSLKNVFSKIDIENKKHTKKLLNIATKAKQNVLVSPIEATNIFVMKGIENKNYMAIE